MVITALTPAYRIVCSVGETAHRSTCLNVLEDTGNDMAFRAASVLLPCPGGGGGVCVCVVVEVPRQYPPSLPRSLSAF